MSIVSSIKSAKNPFDIELMTVTPELAAEWMKKNVRNRPLKSNHVDNLAYALIAGEWQINGESIKFDKDGNLIDGQHRLQAIIESGVAMDTHVMSGFSPDTFATIDTGRLRNGSDILSLEGYKYGGPLSTAARLVCISQLSKNWNGYGSQKIKPTNQDILRAVEKYPKLSRCVERIQQSDRAHIRKLMGAGPAAFVYFWCAKKDPNNADGFFYRIEFGEQLTRKMPEYQLRSRLNTLLLERGGGSNGGRRERMALWFKAWNKFRRNEECSTLRFGATEDFPVPI